MSVDTAPAGMSVPALDAGEPAGRASWSQARAVEFGQVEIVSVADSLAALDSM